MTQKWVLPVVVLAILAVWGVTCYFDGRGDEQDKQEATAYKDTTALLRAQLDTALSRRDSIVDTVKVERVRIVERVKQVEVVKKEFQRDTTTADSLDTALQVIAAQDTLIGWVRDTVIAGDTVKLRVGLVGHIKTLNELVAADSGVIRLYRSHRVTDSTRIHRLERKVLGPRLFGIRLPKPKCGVGGGATYGLQNNQVAVGPTVSCVLTF